MYDFQSIAREFWQDPLFHFLFVGPNSERSAAVLDEVKGLDSFSKDKIALATDFSAEPESIQRIVEQQRLRAGKDNQSLIVVWDLEGLVIHCDWQNAIGRIHQAMPESPQQISLGILKNDHRISFSTFVQLVELNFAHLGTTSECIRALRRWCGDSGGRGDSLDLTFAGTKQPSRWICEIYHDYFGNFVVHLEVELKQFGLWDAQLTFDFWQNAFRNTLLSPKTDQTRRYYQPERTEDRTEIHKRVYHTSPSVRLIVPAGMKDDFLKAHFATGQDFSVYRSPEEAVARLDDLRREGIACVLIRDPATPRISVSPLESGPRHVPTILVGEPEAQASWSQWTGMFRDNVLGSFTKKEFFDSMLDETLPRRKRDAWAPFCYVSLPEALETMLKISCETYGVLRDRLPENKMKLALPALYRSLVQLWYARGLYFSPPCDAVSS